ncbi:hypothetical protein IHV12_04180 [Fictibacillus sp. 7GRE50]|uniref:hypothetical protein n=1 Tax=Fictibacillus sp. 7GRE50 TaxID=2745878 RepID=UPI0018CDD283|nr:hypothetical protein [Fictibacillus sp. 7GRE50]MBH0164098.1 hypothetical protein [Fictibacillus sp. 7GRE50]
MRKKVNRYRYNIVKISKYIKENDIKLPLTDEELKPFIVGTENFGAETAFPIEDGNCYVCSETTVWVDRIHFVHICSEDCMKAIDKRYEKGEEIIRNEEIYKHLEEHEYNLMMDFIDKEKPH